MSLSLPMAELSLEEQVAQCFMVGYSGAEPGEITHRFLERGVGGLIFFRDNFESLDPPHADTVKALLESLVARIPARLPRPLMGIDQEGGQVERLPHRLFPSLLTPRAIALSSEPEALAEEVYALMAKQLKALGFNLNFFPTLDVNLNPKNPIIGVRSFGENAETVWRLAEIALQAFARNRLIAVGKHFPGHGHGEVDSHLDLPVLHFTETELMPFRRAINAGLPVMLAAHGFYPELQTAPSEQEWPSSLSPTVLQGLLRGQCGFEGVIITDDLCMGAITRRRDAAEAALAAIRAGADILLYKQSTVEEWRVYEAVVDAYRTGVLPMSRLRETLARIERLKAQYIHAEPSSSDAPPLPDPAACRKLAERLAVRGIGVVSGDPACLPVHPEKRLWLIYPDRSRMGNYAFDVPTSPEWSELLGSAGYRHAKSLAYPPREAFSAEALLSGLISEPISGELPAEALWSGLSSRLNADASSAETPDIIVFITFNLILYPDQAALYRMLTMRYPAATVILASAGMSDMPIDMPTDSPLRDPALHLSLCSYRPATMRALLGALQAGLPAKEAPPSAVASEIFQDSSSFPRG